jgi:quercetin dioxygenase-like cupin family protein
MSEYSMLHKHNADEINLIVSENSKLKYEIKMDDETYKVTSPSTVFIPKGVRHNAKFISGKGIFVCIILSGKYKSSK